MIARRALVTGGAGFIGSHIVERLVAMGVEVVVLDDLSTGRLENVTSGASMIVGNVCELRDVEKAVEGVDVVFHQAARVSVRDSIAHFHEDAVVNLLGTLNVLKAIASGRGVRKLVYASSMAVYADSDRPPVGEDHLTAPLSPYGIAKLASEKYCLQVGARCGVDVLCLRYFNTLGPRQSYTPYVGVVTIFVNRLLKGEAPVIFGDGEQIRDFVHVHDVAEANIRAMESEGVSGVYNVGSGSGTTVNALARRLIDRLAPGIEPEFAPAQAGELRNSVADISRAVTELGYRPAGRLEEGLDEVIDWWSSRGGLEGERLRR
ncbi:MAG: NAD-dependent epimerase/dehydratase family protein [Candidatus Rokuibacteriota bacterium]